MATLDHLSELVRAAKPIPLTGQVRLDSSRTLELIGAARLEFPHAEEAFDLLEDLVNAGLPIPLCDEVRVDRRRLERALGAARSASEL